MPELVCRATGPRVRVGRRCLHPNPFASVRGHRLWRPGFHDGVVSRVGEVEEIPDGSELDAYTSKDVLSAQSARAMAAHLEEAAAIHENS